MKYTTHKLPMAKLDPNSQTSGQEFGVAGKEPSLERGDSVDVLQLDNQQDEQNSSQSELEQELLSHADGVVDELDEAASVGNHDEVESGTPARSTNG